MSAVLRRSTARDSPLGRFTLPACKSSLRTAGGSGSNGARLRGNIWRRGATEWYARMLEAVLLYTDGAARGNPGPAAAGFRILTSSGELLFEHEESLAEKTNNQAEYAALISGLKACNAYTRNRVRVGSDSTLMVNQMRRAWRVKHPELRRLHEEARTQAASFQEVSYDHHRPSHPEIAAVDRALNRLLDLEAGPSASGAAERPAPPSL
jgi:ribonuclease HI